MLNIRKQTNNDKIDLSDWQLLAQVSQMFRSVSDTYADQVNIPAGRPMCSARSPIRTGSPSPRSLRNSRCGVPRSPICSSVWKRPGWSPAGEVTATGADSGSFKPGDAVYGATLGRGTFTEYVLVKASSLALKPRSWRKPQAGNC